MNEKGIGKFLRLLTHDLQNQLGAIDLNLQIIPTLTADGDPTAKLIEPFVARAALASSEMIETLQHVQSFARSVSRADENGSAAPVVLSKCDLSAKVRDCAMVIAAVAKEREVILRTSVVDDICALGEADSIRQCLKILASEALRSSFPQSTVELNVFVNPVPTIEIATSQEGVFEENRPLLSVSLARQLLDSSRVTLLFVSRANRSAIQLLFQPA